MHLIFSRWVVPVTAIGVTGTTDVACSGIVILLSILGYRGNQHHLLKCRKTLVAGYGDWLKKHHRYVRKGEKAIRILAPTPYKKKKEMDVIDEHGNTSGRKTPA